MHIHEQSIRPWAVRAHGLLGKSYPILGWVQMLLGAATFRSFCRGGHLGQCLAHYIMVSFNALVSESDFESKLECNREVRSLDMVLL